MAELRIGAPVYINNQQGTVAIIDPLSEHCGVSFGDNPAWYPFTEQEVLEAPSYHPDFAPPPELKPHVIDFLNDLSPEQLRKLVK